MTCGVKHPPPVARRCVTSCAKKGRRTNAVWKIIAAELGTQLRKSVTIDWTLRAVTDAKQRPGFQSARAKIKVLVKRIETRSLPTLTHCFPRSFTFYVVHSPSIHSAKAWLLTRARPRSVGLRPALCAVYVSRLPTSIHSADLEEEAKKKVLAQAELLCADWAVVA